MFASGKLMMIGNRKPSPPYPTITMVTATVAASVGYQTGVGGSLTSNVWHPDPTLTINGVFRNSSNGWIFLQVGGLISDADSGDWSFFKIGATSFLRSAATITGPSGGQLTYRWTSGTNPIGSAGSTRILEIG